MIHPESDYSYRCVPLTFHVPAFQGNPKEGGCHLLPLEHLGPVGVRSSLSPTFPYPLCGHSLLVLASLQALRPFILYQPRTLERDGVLLPLGKCM